MERESINYKKIGLPIKIQDLNMKEGGNYRGIHSHSAVEIVEVKNGILYCYVNNDIIEVHPRQVIFVNRNTLHRLYSDNAEITYLQFDVSLFEDYTEHDVFSRLHEFISHTRSKSYLLFSDNNEIKVLLNKINNKYSEESEEARRYIKAYLYELVAFMYSQSFITSFSITQKQLSKVEPIVRYIDANFKFAITLDEVCSIAKYNKHTVCHIFKETTGSTVFDYINFLRIQYAIEKLKNNNNSILEISSLCGFSSPAYFNRVFKKIVGCAPSTYRKFITLN